MSDWIETTNIKGKYEWYWRIRFRYFEYKQGNSIVYSRITRNWFQPIEMVLNYLVNRTDTYAIRSPNVKIRAFWEPIYSLLRVLRGQ